MTAIVYHSVRMPCTQERAYAMFTDPKLLANWLVSTSRVEPVPGGAYELFWNPATPEHDSTLGCKITALEENVFLSFDWKGPRQFETFMNTADPLTHVVVFFTPVCAEVAPLTDVHLVHTGWGSTPEWEEARQWFDAVWRNALLELKRIVEYRFVEQPSQDTACACPIERDDKIP